jgi:Ankyrin repeats (3 copies)
MDGEELDDTEKIEISVNYFRYKSTDVLIHLKELIPVNLVDHQNRTLLHWAAFQGHINKVRFLVENEIADVNIRDTTGYTCLELACKKGHKAVSAYLKLLGLECSLPPLKRLSVEPQLEVENYIATCMFADNSEELSLQLKFISNPNGLFTLSDYFEWSLLGLCGYFLAPKCMHKLIEFGCNLQTEDGDGHTVMDNVLNGILAVLPPENEQEYIELNSGADCLAILLKRNLDIKNYLFRINKVLEKSSLVGKGSSVPHTEYEAKIEKKTKALRLALSKILQSRTPVEINEPINK